MNAIHFAPTLAAIEIGWLVPIVVAFVYVIGAITKSRDQKKNEAQRTGGTGRPPGQQLDRFLAEIERLRRQQAERPAVTVVDESEKDEDERPVIVIRQQPRPIPPPAPPVVRAAPQPQTPRAAPLSHSATTPIARSGPAVQRAGWFRRHRDRHAAEPEGLGRGDDLSRDIWAAEVPPR